MPVVSTAGVDGVGLGLGAGDGGVTDGDAVTGGDVGVTVADGLGGGDVLTDGRLPGGCAAEPQAAKASPAASTNPNITDDRARIVSLRIRANLPARFQHGNTSRRVLGTKVARRWPTGPTRGPLDPRDQGDSAL